MVNNKHFDLVLCVDHAVADLEPWAHRLSDAPLLVVGSTETVLLREQLVACSGKRVLVFCGSGHYAAEEVRRMYEVSMSVVLWLFDLSTSANSLFFKTYLSPALPPPVVVPFTLLIDLFVDGLHPQLEELRNVTQFHHCEVTRCQTGLGESVIRSWEKTLDGLLLYLHAALRSSNTWHTMVSFTISNCTAQFLRWCDTPILVQPQAPPTVAHLPTEAPINSS